MLRWYASKKGTCLGDHALGERRVTHLYRRLHRMSVLVVVDARFTRRSGQDLCTHTRRAPRCAPVFHEGREQREDALRYQPKNEELTPITYPFRT